jgi:serine/threonine protein kinase
MQPTAAEGFVDHELIGFGLTGEVWRARRTDTGEVVAVKRLRAQAMAVVDRLRREAGIVARIAEPGAAENSAAGNHVVAVREVLVTSAEVVLVSDFVAGDSLETLLVGRNRLMPGEVVTLLAPLAETLGRLHRAGLVHGGLTPANVLIAPDGRPLLTDVGVAVAMGERPDGTPDRVPYVAPEILAGGAADPAADVYALAAVGAAALGWLRADREVRTADEPVAELLAAVTSAEPVRRPGAAELAAALLQAAPAAPIRGASGARRALSATSPLIPTDPLNAPPRLRSPDGARRPPGAPVRRPTSSSGGRTGKRSSRSTRRAGWRIVAVVGAVVLSVAAAGAVHHHGSARSRLRAVAPAPSASPSSRHPTAPGTPSQSGEFSTPPSSPPASGSPPPASWRSIVQALEARRAAAFTQARPALLHSVYVAGSADLRADLATAESMQRRGLRAQRFAARVRAVDLIARSAGEVHLRVVDALSAYTLVDVDGLAHGGGIARPARTVNMALVKTAAGWRIRAVTASSRVPRPGPDARR